MAIEHQASPEIQEFLVYWLLEQVSAEEMPPGQLGVEVVRLSDGDLRPAESDVRAAQLTCWQHGWISAPHPFSLQAASLSAGGRRELNRRAAAATAAGAEMEGDLRQQAAERLLSLLSPPGEHGILDVGTGGGFLARKLAAAGFRVLGIDRDAEAIRAAGEGVPPDGLVRFVVADIHELANQRQRWPTIVTSYLLHECDDPIATLRSICACLEPGGRLACMDFAPNCAAYLSGVGRTRFHAFRALAQADWQALAPQLGLTVEEQLCFGYVSLTLARRQPQDDGRTLTARIGGEHSMKIAVTSTGPGLDAPVDPRFGRAACILIVDPESMAVEPTENPSVQASGGAGVQTAQMVAATGATAVLTGNVGPNAYYTLSAAGLKVYVGAAGTVREAVEAYSRGELGETTEPSVGSHFGVRQTPG